VAEVTLDGPEMDCCPHGPAGAMAARTRSRGARRSGQGSRSARTRCILQKTV